MTSTTAHASTSWKWQARRILQIALPVMLSYLGHVLVGTADSMMVGQLGKVPLAAVSLANSIVVLPMMFGLGLSYGLTPLVAAADGRGNRRRIANLLQHSLLINVLAGAALAGLIVLLLPFLDDMEQPPAVVDIVGAYLAIAAGSLIPLMAFQAFKQFAEGLGYTRQAMYITLLANGVNVFFNWLLIYGNWGFPALGLAGAGWATLLSRILMAIGMAWYCYKSPLFERYRDYFHFSRFKKKMSVKLIKLGIPMGLQFTFEVGAFSGAVIMAGWISDTAQAAHQIAINLASMSYMIASGISAAATVQVGNLLGRKDVAGLRTAAVTSAVLVLVLQTLFALLFLFGRHLLPTLYIDNTNVIDIAAGLLVIAAFFQLSDGLQVVGLGALRGMEDVRVPTWITLFAYWILALPLGYLLGFTFDLGIVGVWWGLLTGLTVAAILLAVRFWWLSDKSRIQQLGA
ncbi:MATE family efflux transporter [Cesiribacter sp. SM1]|uniref:MATE family efflux transporter n=1 Tax=Cesiribacter sp. SM1 TaxID=2861196 RepID=UPI001CD44646|nr:MATE family efflux transporter [Cesiribacter sp. SM1]